MKTFIILCLLITSQFLWGQDGLYGRLSEDTRWYGEVTITGDIVVPQGVSLKIDAGTRISISAKSDVTKSGKDPEHIEIIVIGELIAEGSDVGGKIIFTSNSPEPRLHDWYGIVLKNRTTASYLNNCIVEYANKGITCFASAPIITNSDIRYNQFAGINCEIRSAPFIENTTFYGNDFAGIVCEYGATPVIEKCTISQNGNGIVISDKSQPDLGRANPAEGESAGQNFILNNFEYNIYNYSSREIYAQNNLWNTIDQAEIQNTIFDQSNHASMGQVIITPLIEFEAMNPAMIMTASAVTEQPDPPASSPKVDDEPPARQQKNASQSRSRSVTQSTPPPTRTQTQTKPKTETPPPAEETSSTLAAGAAVTAGIGMSTSKPIERNNDVQSQPVETAPAKTEQEDVKQTDTTPKTTSSTPAVTEPIIERLLDKGKREYIRRENAKYPQTYRKFKNDGKVLLEVFVGKDGRVENYRVLKSDGDLFTDSAIDALKTFRYKPGTYQGQPVRFKIVEPFIFKYYE